MTIATLILTCTIFVSLGWTGDFYAPVALCVGAIVCIAAANAGATSQDLKTGFLVGATPRYQQIGLMIGVVASAFVIGQTTLYLNDVMVRTKDDGGGWRNVLAADDAVTDTAQRQGQRDAGVPECVHPAFPAQHGSKEQAQWCRNQDVDDDQDVGDDGADGVDEGHQGTMLNAECSTP